MKIEEIMTRDVLYAEVPGGTTEALDLIIKKNVSGLPVVKKGTKELIGVVTKDDFARRPDEGQLALLMTRSVVTIAPEADVLEATRIFLKKGFRRLPVAKGKELIGIVSVSDIVWKAIAAMATEETIEKYVEERVAAVWEETPLRVAYMLMRLAGGRALSVLDSEGKLVGILADTDLLRVTQLTESTQKSEVSLGTEGDRWGWDSKNVMYITKKRLELPDLKVKDIMVKNVITATKKTSIPECAKKMARMKVEQIPVIDADGDIIGLVRDISLLRAFGS
ncbi:MAG: CBS domain-containing protein [Candidatus Hydrothermarchaeota archaeon]